MITLARNPRRFWGVAILLSLAAGLSPSLAYSQTSLNRVFIQSLLDFNAILITEVDVVFVYDQSTADQFPATKGQWYAQKYDLLKDDPIEFDVITTSIPQGFDSTTVSLPERHATALKVFAVGYHEAGDVPVHDLTDLINAQIQIDQFGILVSGQ